LWGGNINYGPCKGLALKFGPFGNYVDQKYLESFEKWFWRRMEKITGIDRVSNEEVAQTFEGRNILQSIKRRNAN
jgi:hypothetical protein